VLNYSRTQSFYVSHCPSFYMFPKDCNKGFFLARQSDGIPRWLVESFVRLDMYLRCLGKAFSSKERDDSRDGEVKFVGSGSNELGLNAHPIVELTISSKLKSSDSNSASHSASSSISSLCHLSSSQWGLPQKIDRSYHKVVLLGWRRWFL